MGRSKGHIPIRTCVSCGAKGSKRDLVRFKISQDRRVIMDKEGKGKGRGIYICKSISCLERFVKNKRLTVAFRCEEATSILRTKILGE